VLSRALTTERTNPASAAVDARPTAIILRIIQEQDAQVPATVRAEIPHIARAVEAVVRSLRRGGRLLYVGAGTSGRLGVLESAEMPPTFGTDASLVQALMAGGKPAVLNAK
jgi:N-acetylmuramic acid 6-phosphate etherase